LGFSIFDYAIKARLTARLDEPFGQGRAGGTSSNANSFTG